jgi:bisanhydrobacterioruberin hydratase
MLGSFGVFCFVYPFAILLLSFDWMPFGMEWMSSLLLAMLGLASAGWLWANFGSAGVGMAALIFALGVSLEYTGVLTGFPFGPSEYTGVLVPELPGGVPFAIGFAWLLVVVGGTVSARALLLPMQGRPALSIVLVCLLCALLAVGLDLLLEPVSYHIKHYWRWLTPGETGYYGIPWSNFAAWFVATALFSLPLAAALSRRGALTWVWLPVTLLGMNAAMFGIVNLAHGYWLSGAVMILLLFLSYRALTKIRQYRNP